MMQNGESCLDRFKFCNFVRDSYLETESKTIGFGPIICDSVHPLIPRIPKYRCHTRLYQTNHRFLGQHLAIDYFEGI